MKATLDLDRLRLDAQDPEETALLARVSRLAYQQGLSHVASQKGSLELTAGRLKRQRHAVTEIAIYAAASIGRRGPDWLAALGLAALGGWALGLAHRVIPPRVALGIALLLFGAAAGLVGALSFRGVKPQSFSLRYWKWAYWTGAVAFVAAVVAAILASVLWIAWVLGSLAVRLTP